VGEFSHLSSDLPAATEYPDMSNFLPLPKTRQKISAAKNAAKLIKFGQLLKKVMSTEHGSIF